MEDEIICDYCGYPDWWVDDCCEYCDPERIEVTNV